MYTKVPHQNLFGIIYLFIICIIYLKSSKCFLQLEHDIELLVHQQNNQYQG